jgi:hypothetical protein
MRLWAKVGCGARFLYEAFVRVLQLFRRYRNEQEELAIEVVMLRHEVSILRYQVACPTAASGQSSSPV